jgi:hypothetical protein
VWDRTQFQIPARSQILPLAGIYQHSMRQLIIAIISLLSLTTFGQSIDDYNKVKIYKTALGQVYLATALDSIFSNSDNYFALRKSKETKDTIIFILNSFNKELVADRYQVDGFYCGNFARKDLAEIRKKFPYNRTHTIKVVSFKDSFNIPMNKGKIDFEKMHEIKTLDNDLTNKMTDILVNFDNRNLEMGMAFCWSPRNAIIFLDKKGKVLGYFVICFHCQVYEFAPKSFTFGRFCNEKMDAIQGIMMKAGITYGMKSNEE